MTNKTHLSPGDDLYNAVKGAFITRGSSLSNHLDTTKDVTIWTASKALLGKRNGPKARALRARLAEAAGVSYQEAA